LTVGCAQCHDHKYDPLTQKEYYQLFAFFHNVPENGLDGKSGNAVPVLPVPTPVQRQRLDRLATQIKELEGHPGPELDRLRKERAALEKRLPTTMVMEEMP